MKKFAISALFFAAPFFALADYYADMLAYEPGKSTAWFFELRADSLSGGKKETVSVEILKKLDENKVSSEAFRLACEILKPIADVNSVEMLRKYVVQDAYSAPACDVLLGIDSSDVDGMFADAYPNAPLLSKMNIISTLAARGKSVGFIAEQADSKEKEIALFAIGALGSLSENASYKALAEIVEKGDYRKDAATEALVKLAWRAFCDGKKSLAVRALKIVPENYPLAVAVRGRVSKDRQGYLDAIMIEGAPNYAAAARVMNDGRDYEKSSALVKAFPTLSKNLKLAAIGTFIEAGDARYFAVIESEMDSADEDIRAEAIYAARFLAAADASLRKVFDIYKQGQKPYSEMAQKVLEENASPAMQAILKEKSATDLDALKILVKRGDIQARNELWRKFFGDNGWKDPKVSGAIDETITYAYMPDFAAAFKKVKDDDLRQEMAKIIIKKLARSRDKGFIKKSLDEILQGNIDGEDKLAVLMKSKLGVLEKQTGQPNHGNAIDDRMLTLATEKEPVIDRTFVALFNGKNLDGWKTTTGSAKYSVVDGSILGEVDPKMKHNSFLITERDNFKNFIFSCEFKWVEHGNSGIMFRAKRRDNGKGSVYGPQSEIDNSPRGWTAGIYYEGWGWKYSVSRKDQGEVRKAVKLDGWNKVTIKCVGSRMQTWLNGVPVSDLVWDEFTEGFFGLQVHAGGKCSLMWKNIVVKELK